MTVQLTCPWCQDEADFVVRESTDELVCSACSIRLDFAPDPAITFGLLYEPVAA